MAGIAYRSTSTASSAKPVAPSMPAGFAAGDVLVSIMSVGSALGGTITVPSGWTQVGATTTNSFAGTKQTFAYRIADGTETTVSWTWSGSATVGNAVVHAFSGADPASPIDVIGAITLGSGGAGSTSQSIAGVTAIYAQGDYAVCLAYTGGNRTVSSPQVGGVAATQDSYKDTTGAAGGSGSGEAWLVFHRQLAASGASGNATWTAGTNDSSTGVVIAIKPPNPFSRVAYQFVTQQAVNRASTY